MITIVRKNGATAQSTQFRAWVLDVEFAAMKAGYSCIDAKELTEGEDEALLKLFSRGLDPSDALEAFLKGA